MLWSYRMARIGTGITDDIKTYQREYHKKYYAENKDRLYKHHVEYMKTYTLSDEQKLKRNEYHRRYYMEKIKPTKEVKKRGRPSKAVIKEVSASEALAVPVLPAGAMETAHSMVSPSSLERVCKCPASVYLCKDLPDTESEVAAEGTEFHAAMEDLLTNPPSSNEDLEERITKLPSMEMQNYVRSAYDYISGILVRLKPEKLEIETKLPAVYSDKDFGTIDVAALYPNGDGTYNVLVLDWKYGKGHFVEVEENKQLLSYALSYVHHAECAFNAKIKFVTTVIYQPRLPADDGKIARSKTYNLDKLNQLAVPLKEKVAIAYKILNGEEDVDKYTQAGTHCLFCKLKPECKKYKEFIMQDAIALINDINEEKKEKTSLQEVKFKDINTLTADEILKVITFGETILPKLKSYIEDVMSMIQVKLEAGEKIPGLKLVKGRGRRKWIDDEELVINTLESEGIEASKPTLKTLTEIEAALKSIGKKDLLDSLVVMSEGKARVALEDDKRKEISESLISDL